MPLKDSTKTNMGCQEHRNPLLHNELSRTNPYVKATPSNFQALRYVLVMDDYHKGFLAYHKILILENSHFFKFRKPMEF